MIPRCAVHDSRATRIRFLDTPGYLLMNRSSRGAAGGKGTPSSSARPCFHADMEEHARQVNPPSREDPQHAQLMTFGRSTGWPAVIHCLRSSVRAGCPSLCASTDCSAGSGGDQGLVGAEHGYRLEFRKGAPWAGDADSATGTAAERVAALDLYPACGRLAWIGQVILREVGRCR